ncbi:hypothetical protein GCM10011487_70290 [Steroidobacter agaridevorans]|uniref:Thioredoxin domain-containing protein n=1 Tax=Steroidobacter agaridevorans TaxID=2695856 RepID=A0A829YPE4_9GAMM|nr:hypothetical protein [Steroidobacter agaridevorans]GFE85029.1 hypothetical protein GCM10011487_70290 [Steroidobacter agaridevorans]GFE86891.1 hypothetical protein GCM10011488_18450 [Steroidobacter agaridevorans]
MFETTYVLLWVIAIIQGLAICSLILDLSALRDEAPKGLKPATEGLPTGSPAPRFTTVDVRSGGVIEWSTLRGRRTVFLFLSVDCDTCKILVSELASLAPESLSEILICCSGAATRCREILGSLPKSVPILDDNRALISNRCRLRTLPALVVIDSEWQIEAYRYPEHSAELRDFLPGALAATARSGAVANSLPAETTPSQHAVGQH